MQTFPFLTPKILNDIDLDKGQMSQWNEKYIYSLILFWIKAKFLI